MYTTKQRNEIYKKLKNMLTENGIIMYDDYCRATEDFGYIFRHHSDLPELSLFEPCRLSSTSEVKIVQPIALEFCVVMTEQ